MKDTIFLERQLEAAKAAFIQHYENYPCTLFKQIYCLFDPDGLGNYLTPQIFKETLQLLQVVSSVTDEDIYLLFARYNGQQDGMLTLEDLTSMIAPLFF